MKSRIFPLLRKEMLHILRDPRSLYLAVGLPLLLVVLFGYAITFDIRNVAVAVVDQDNTGFSRDLISRLDASPYFELKLVQYASSGLEALLDKGDVKIIVSIPSGFSRNLAQGKNAPLQLLVDGSDNNTAKIALGYVSGVIHLFSADVLGEKSGNTRPYTVQAVPLITAEPRVWYNPDLLSTHFIVPGLIAVVMMVLTAMLTSLTIAREWETGTMEQLMASPVRPHEVIIGKLIPYYGLGILQAASIVAAGTQVFKVPLKGNLIFLFCATSLFLVCGLGIGLLISTVTRSQQLAFMMSILLTLLPSFLLSGFIFPVSSMPRIIQFATLLVPAKYFLTILRGIFLKGNGLDTLWPEVLSLLVFALFLVVACARRLKLSLE